MTLTREQIERALDHLRSDYPEPMSAEEREDYYLVLQHFRPGELMHALEKLPTDHRPSAWTLIQTVMEARPGQRIGKPDPFFVKAVIERARRDLRVRDAV